MGTMSINPLLVKLSVPMMVSMLVQALYNVVDSIFVSHVSESALTVSSLAFPLQNVAIAVGAVPVSASTRRCPRARRKGLVLVQDRRKRHLPRLLQLCGFCHWPDLHEVLLLCTDQRCGDRPAGHPPPDRLLGVQPWPVYADHERVSLVSNGPHQPEHVHAAHRCHRQHRADLIFIFGYCGEALSGTTGAAVATVIGQFCGAGAAIFFNLKKNLDIQSRLARLPPQRCHQADLHRWPAQHCDAVRRHRMTFLMQILMAFGHGRRRLRRLLPPRASSYAHLRMNNGMVPIISYNYGARRPTA